MIENWIFIKDELLNMFTKFENSIFNVEKYMNEEFMNLSYELSQLKTISESVNNLLYHSPKIEIQKNWDFNKKEEVIGFLGELKDIIKIWRKSIDLRSGLNLDRDFWDLYECFKYVDKDYIYDFTIQRFKKLPMEIQLEYIKLPQRYSFLKGKIDIEKQDYSLIKEYVEMMKTHIDDYKWLFNHLADYRSKLILNEIIRYWFNFDIADMHNMVETVYSDYFDLDITGESNDDMVFVDLGAYTGDSVFNFINTYGVYKKIYAYELTPSTYKNLKKNTEGIDNIECIQKGIGKEQTFIHIVDDENNAGNSILYSGNVKVELTTLDADIEERIGMIKMDIEGAEKDALLGAKRHIMNDRPILLISAYHISGDIFDIPMLINEMRDDYKYYLRFNGHGCLWPCDYVIFAV